MTKTIEAMWRDGFLNPDALVAPQVNDLYTRKSRHIVDRIRRKRRINEIACLSGGPMMWAVLSVVGVPYAGAAIWAAMVGLFIHGRLSCVKFDAPDTGLDSYQYLKAFQAWLTDRLARAKRVQRHLYAVVYLAVSIGLGASEPGQRLIRFVIESNPDFRLIGGIPLVLIAAVVVITIVVDLLGGVLFDCDVNLVYRGVFRKLDQMVAEMEELRG